MTTLSVGALCTVRQFGTRLWVATEPLPDNRYRLTCKQVDGRGRAAYQTRVVGLGDITVIKDAGVYEIGSTVTYEGLDHLVLDDLGDDGVEVGVPEHGVQTRGGDVIRIPSGNVRVLHKADLILAGMH